MKGLEDFTNAYIEAIYFADTGDTDEPDSDIELSQSARAMIDGDCIAFWAAYHRDILKAERRGEGYSNAQFAGHDFWLTRNGHGVGFWDGDWPEPLATTLTDACETLGTRYVYEGDDGLLYMEHG